MSTPRAQPSVVLSTLTPAILHGRPVLPTHWAKSSSTTTAVQGSKHIHAIKDPDTYKDPSGIVNPPSRGDATHAGPWTARWTVRTLPDPASYPNGFYWLGAASSADGTQNIAAGARQWAPDVTTPHAPSWHSFFPFKPSVTAVDHYLQGGGIVHHKKGVNFNSHFIEHMWMDWGSDHRQPFTWVIAASVASWPDDGYVHHLLDSGRNPSAVGFPRLSADDCNSPRHINDGLAYRNMLTIGHDHLAECARPDSTQNKTVRARTNPARRPRMYIGIFNGANSFVGAYSPGLGRLRKGQLDNTSDQHHRYYVMGRKHGRISQDDASHLLVFEIRYWNKALNADQLKGQYEQISSTWQFDQYRGLS